MQGKTTVTEFNFKLFSRVILDGRQHYDYTDKRNRVNVFRVCRFPISQISDGETSGV